jgi:hypothetical protein
MKNMLSAKNIFSCDEGIGTGWGQVAECCEHGSEPFSSIKDWEFLH